MTAEILTKSLVLCGILSLSGCGLFDTSGPSNASAAAQRQQENTPIAEARNRETIWDLFANVDDPNVTVEVNRYIWNATLDILDFMPVESADPFSGVLVFGYGTPPGSSRAYRANVFIQDPALDARSLNVALLTRSGPADTETIRAIEDAILTRARQLRVRDGDL